jgi:hypothetical protein
MYAQAYIMHMFWGIIFTSTAVNTMTMFFLTLLKNFWVIPNYSWVFMFAYLY